MRGSETQDGFRATGYIAATALKFNSLAARGGTCPMDILRTLASLFLFLFIGSVGASKPSPEELSAAGRPGSLADTPLPWRHSAGDSGANAAASSAREWLESADIDASRLANLSLGEPLDAGDEETVLAILYRLPRLPTATLEQWTATAPPWADVAGKLPQHQAQVFRVAGRAKRVERVNLLPEAAERFEFDHYYRVEFALEAADWPATICVRSVPRTWPDDGSLDERAAAYGLLLKTGQPEGTRPPLIFTAARLQWFPDRIDAALGVSAGHVYLAELGMDVARFDDLQRSDRKALGAEDRECFYESLAAMKRASHGSLQRHAEKAFDLATLLNRPAAARGRLAEVRGAARRIQRIEITDSSRSKRLGLDHYYQMEVFVPLGDQVVKLGEGRAGEETPTFVHNFPVIVCVPSLPAGLNADLDMSVEVVVPAVFLKVWAFRTQYVASFDKRQLQLGPLLVGCCPELISPPADRFTPLTTRLGIGLLFALLAAAYGLWHWQRAEARAYRRLRDR